ncbi:MAG: NUDIX domain-containing protein [Candidatus Paceibacterota bacterium]
MEEKRHNSMLIPYYFKKNNLYVFLQRRNDDAPRNPNILGGFGGGLEGEENNEDALIREMNEELEYTPKNYSLLGTFETDHSISNYYIEEVDENFENNVIVHEGKRGEWHEAIKVVERDDISPNTKRVINSIILKFR